MSEFSPVTTVKEFSQLDADDVVAGYWAGYNGSESPGSDKSRGYHHGYLNGAVDSGRAKISPEQERFCHAVVDAQKAH